jgi:Sulfatase
MKFKNIVQGFGAAILILIVRLWPHLSSYHPVIYHSILPMRTVIWGVLIDLGVFTLLAALLFGYLEKKENGLRTVLWAFVAAELASALVTALAAMKRAPIPYLQPNTVAIVTLLAALLLRWLRPLDYRRAVRAFGVLLVLGGCSMVWMLPELLYQGLIAERVDGPIPERHPVTLISGPKNSAVDTAGKDERIVWLIFDELSYDQTFDHRFPGLAMPAFDQLKSESVLFRDVKPAGYYTDRVIPSFFLGATIDNVRSGLDGEPKVKLVGSNRWRAFDTRATIFADAQRLGWSTGVVGWYNPYCRMLAGTLNYCFWREGDGQSDGALAEHSAWENAVAPLTEIARGFKHEPGFAQARHAEDQAVLMPQAEALLRDQSISFVFIHLPLPHPPSVYDRTHKHSAGSYIDNLVLADRALNDLMGTLQQTPMAGKTTVILCSDHSWRVPMWRSGGGWTEEDEIASHGRFDPRPVLMIHFPGQQNERDVTAPFDAIRIHEIIEHLLRGQEPGFEALLATKP